MIKQNCSICNKDEWKDLDYLRDQLYWYEKDMREEDEPVGFKVCKHCGFVTYDYVDNERLAQHYDRERKVVTFNNIVTCNRKNMYHRAFLGYEDSNMIDCPGDANVLDVGMAQGSFLDDLMEYGYADGYYGTEWSDGFRRFAANEYGIIASKEIDESVVYDFISYYHVLEHIQYPEKELEKISAVMADNGFLYISVPIWEEAINEASGAVCNDFEHWYHLNHVNVFTKQSLKNLIHNAGFEIIKEDDQLYGYTILCQKGGRDQYSIVTEDYKMIEKRLKKQKDVIEFINSDKKGIDKAIEMYPNYPDLYILKATSPDITKSFEESKAVLEQGLEACNNNIKILHQYAILHYQWCENTAESGVFYSNNIKKAEKIFNQVQETKPSEDIFFFLAMIEGKYKKDSKKAAEFFGQVIEVNPARWAECMNNIAKYWKEQGE